MLTALAILSALASIAACILVWGMRNKLGGSGDAVTAAELQSLREKVGAGEGVMRDEFARNRKEAAELAQAQREELRNNLAAVEKKLEDNAKAQQNVLRQQFDDLLKQLHNQGKTSLEAVKDVRETIEKQLKEIREDNGKRLEEMRKTVDEKLQDTLEKRLGESFKQVSERLEQVHKGLGEMQSIASGVGDLKKVLTNVKTKGILGEYQLANIIEQLLPREQYEENVATRPGSTERVEFAIRMPGNSDDVVVWLPIDSKFPLNGYEELLNAREAGDLDAISSAEKALTATLEKFAKDISEKYVEA
ncbi:MAG: DNA recombination protein RmuC, partial [Bacteroidota bacterium]|nr:DNA recombination protein RmuC [Bacteroidota bacterium]